eukprot:CCRYP_004232-RA/>CCRYP_004232-RA protein AED:0.27 eAED:0.27 QI:0/0/0/0.5/1/1/2/0/300
MLHRNGHIPIRIALPPPIPGAPSFTTFLYVKEHIAKHKGSNASDVSSSTLFVAKAPANEPICRNLFLQSFFQRYGDVVRVTVAQDPRKAASPSENGDASSNSAAVEIFRGASLSSVGGDEIHNMEKGDGKFAHVVFSSGKERTRVWKALGEDIAGSEEGILQLDDEDMEALVEKTRILRHLELCNEAMSAYEHTEAEPERRVKQLAEKPDDWSILRYDRISSMSQLLARIDRFTAHSFGRVGIEMVRVNADGFAPGSLNRTGRVVEVEQLGKGCFVECLFPSGDTCQWKNEGECIDVCVL